MSNVVRVVCTKRIKGKTVYICLDTDEAGQNEVGKYINTLEAVEAIPMVITLPKESKDICEYFTAGGTKGTFTKLLDVALSAKEYKKLHQKEEYRIETMTEIVKEEMSEEGWLIDKILPIEGFVFIVGAEATGKSFYSLTMANSVTTGEKWLGEFEVIKQTKVLFIDKENTRRRTQKRIKGLNITEQATNKMFRLRYPEFFQLQKQESDMSSDGFSDFAHQASDLVKEEGIGMIVVDSFTDIMVGNENAAADTQAFFDAFRQLFPGVLFATLHHDNKAVQGVDLRTSGQRIRGSTNIPAQIVAGFRATPIPKTKNEFSFEQVKAGDSEKLDPFKIKLVVEDDPEDITKTIVARLEYGGKYFSEEGKIAQAKEAIIELFAKNPTMLREEIVSGAMTDNNGEFSPRTVTTALKQLVDHDLISKEQVGRKVQYLWVGDN